MKDITLTRSGAFDAFDSGQLCAAHDLLGNRVGDAGSQRDLDRIPPVLDLAPLIGLRDRVRQKLIRQKPKVRLRQFSFYKKQVVELERPQTAQAEGLGIGKGAVPPQIRISTGANDDTVDPFAHSCIGSTSRIRGCSRSSSGLGSGRSPSVLTDGVAAPAGRSPRSESSFVPLGVVKPLSNSDPIEGKPVSAQSLASRDWIFKILVEAVRAIRVLEGKQAT